MANNQKQVSLTQRVAELESQVAELKKTVGQATLSSAKRVELGKEYRIGSGAWITLTLDHSFGDVTAIIAKGQLQGYDYSCADKGVIRLQAAAGGCTLRALWTTPKVESLKVKSATR